MDFAELERIVLGAISKSERRLNLSDDALKSAPIRALIDAYFIDDRIVLEQIDEPVIAPPRITVKGTGSNLPFKGMSVEVVFALESSEPTIRATATAQLGWNLGQSFVSLAPTILAELSFRDVRLVFATTSSADTKPGLSFRGILEMTSALGSVAWLLGGASTLEVAGLIQMDMGLPVMTLEAPVAGPVNLGFFRVESMRFQVVATAVPKIQGGVPRSSTVMLFKTAITFGAQGTSLKIPVTAQFFNRISFLHFEADLTQVIPALLKDLWSLLDGVDFTSRLPKGIPLDSVLELDQLVVQLNPVQRQLNFVSLGVRSKTRWTIIDKVISIEEIRVLFMLIRPFSERRQDLIVFGKIAIGSQGKLLTSTTFPEAAFMAQLQDGTNIDVKQLVEHFVGKVPHAPSLVVSAFDLEIAPGTKTYSGSARVDTSWTIPLGSTKLTLRSVAVALERADGAISRAEIAGELTLAGADIQARWKMHEEFQLAGRLPQADLRALIAELSAHPLGEFPMITLVDSQIYIELRSDGSHYLALGTKVARFGAMEIEFLGQGQETGFAFGFVLDGTWSLAELSTVFKPLSFLKFKDASLLAASIDDPNFRFRSFSDPNFQFPAQPPSAPPGVKKGVSLYSKMLLEGGPLTAVAKLLPGTKELDLGLVFPARYAETRFSATLPGKHALIPKYVFVQDVGVDFAPGQANIFTLRTGVLFAIHGHELMLKGQVEVEQSSIVLEINTQQAWSQPFGIKGLTLNKMGASISIGAAITVSLAGEVTIGSGASAIVLDAGIELNGDEDFAPDALLAREVGTIKLSQIVQSFTRSQIPEQILAISLSDFQLIIVANPKGWLDPADGKHYQPGLSVGGTLGFYGLVAQFAIEVDHDTGIYARGQIDKPLVIGDVIRLAAKSNAQQGPYVEIRTANAPYLVMDLALTMFEIVALGVTAHVDKGAFSLVFQYKISGLGQIDVQAQLKSHSEFAFLAKAHFAISRLGPIKAGKFHLGTFKFDLALDAHFCVAVGPSTQFLLTIGASFHLQGLDLRLDDLTLHDKIAKLDQVPKLFADKLAALIWDIGKSLFHNAEALIQFIGKGLIDVTGDLAKILAHELKVSLKKAAALLKSVAHVLAYDAEKVAHLLHEAFSALDHEIAAALKEAGYEVEQVARAIAKVFSKDAKAVAEVLKKAGYELKLIAQALKNVFGYSAEAVAHFFKDAWKVADHLAHEALIAVGYAAHEIANAMKKVFKWVEHAKEEIKDKLNPKHW